MKKFLVLLACLGLACCETQAQTPVRRPPVPDQTQASLLPPAKIEPPDPAAQTVTIDFPNAPVTDVLRYYGLLLGKPVIYDNSVSGYLVLSIKEPTAKEQAMRLIEESLFLNGFSLIDSADGKMVKVIGLGKPARAYGVPVYKAAADLPQAERVVSLIIQLKHMDPVRMAGLLGAYSPPNAMTAFIPGGANTVILTGQTSVVREVLKVLEAFDASEPGPAPAGAAPPK